MLIGIVPMGGSAERWKPYPCPKELLPFGIDSKNQPRVIGDYVLERMVKADVEMVVIPVSPGKATMVMQYFGQRLTNGASIIYLAAYGPTMLANVQSCIPIIKGNHVLFGMPDTYFLPEVAYINCVEALDTSIELVLGSFNHEKPDQLDLVERDGQMLIAVKPKPRPVEDSSTEIWGIAAWNAEFTERLGSDPGPTLGHVFHSAALAGNSRCVLQPESCYIDLAEYSVYQHHLTLERQTKL